MIKLKNVNKHNDTIQCDAYIEDSIEAVPLKLNLSTGMFDEYSLPRGYEWCSSHIAHARMVLIDMAKNENITSERLIMWC